jgi:hypothetical protein
VLFDVVTDGDDVFEEELDAKLEKDELLPAELEKDEPPRPPPPPPPPRAKAEDETSNVMTRTHTNLLNNPFIPFSLVFISG